MTSEQSLTSRDFPVHWPVHTRWTDNDMFGHLNNAVYYALFDTAINAWIDTSCEIDPLRVSWLGVVAESGCKYLSELKFPNPLIVGLAVTRLGNSSVTYRLAIFEEPADAVAAVGHWVHVYVDRTTRKPVPIRTPSERFWKRRAWSSRYARPMPLVSKTVEVAAPAESVMAIVADFESYPLWNDEVKGCWVLARYEDGRPSQLRLDVVVQGQAGTFITAVYYPGENQIYTVLQQGEFFEKQEQKFSVVPIGATSLLTVDFDVETKLPIPNTMVKKAIGDTLDYLAENLKARAEQLAASP